MADLSPMDAAYVGLLDELKGKIGSAQVKAALAVNAELVRLYWEIGNLILSRQQKEGWGTKVIDRLAQDLKAAFPDMKGFSLSNLKYMRQFATVYPESAISQQAVGQIPWDIMWCC
jgi:predicted nuclease of restriction endonuclease-like (RecB) superfamily